MTVAALARMVDVATSYGADITAVATSAVREAENRAELAWVAELFPSARSYLDVYARNGLVGARSVLAHGIVIHGHTHMQEMKARGDTLIVNPGEACGWLFGAPSAAIIDLDTKNVEFIKLDAAEWTK